MVSPSSPAFRRSSLFLLLLVSGVLMWSPAGGWGQTRSNNPAVDRALRHADIQWATIAPHLPDPAVASEQQLELAADVLRARKFPEDALEYYNYALKKAGEDGRLLTKIGVTHMELNNITIARAFFHRAIKAQPKSAERWNNLAATEYLQKDLRQAIKDYKKALTIDGKVATFHSNLGTAYFEDKNYKKAREQYATAMQLDPEIFQRKESGGVTAHVLSPADRGRFCLEMARLALNRNDEAEMLHWLEKASESGLDLRAAMGQDKVFAKYRDDPRVKVLSQSTKALRTMQVTSLGAIPELKPEVPKAQ